MKSTSYIAEKSNQNFVKDLEDLLEILCITKIEEDPKISKSYGGAGSEKAFLAHQKLQGSELTERIDKIATYLLDELPMPEKKMLRNPQKK